MKNKPLKLFVWEGEGVLQDYTSGMVCVLARDLKHALKLIEEKHNYCLGSIPINGYKVVKKPEAFIVWGSS